MLTVSPDECVPSFKKYKSTLASTWLFDEKLSLMWSLGHISGLLSQTRCGVLETLGKYNHPVVPLSRAVSAPVGEFAIYFVIAAPCVMTEKISSFSFCLCSVLKNGQTSVGHSISFMMSSPTSIW